MLVKCPECKNDVSSSATACPKCGHPVASAGEPSREQAKKVSHTAGWLSVAAFILSSFSPAILAPIFVLAGLIFAAKELSGGGRVFGTVALCLTLVQGWFVVDHFGNLRGSLGITTAKDSDLRAAQKYSAVSLEVPSDWRSTAESKCREEWATDYRMQAHCVKQQGEGAQKLAGGAPSGVDADAFRVIRGKCSEEWPRDFRMRAHCEEKQIEGYRALNTSSTNESARNACAQKWPDDYRMRRYCETRK